MKFTRVEKLNGLTWGGVHWTQFFRLKAYPVEAIVPLEALQAH